MTDSFILDIMEKFNSSSIVDLDISRDGSRIALKKADACAATSPAAVPSPVVAVAAPVEPAASEAPSAATAKEEVSTAGTKGTDPSTSAAGTEILKSPIVGTFYRSPSPDSPAYAEVGKTISKGEPICILEAMKMMNTMNADFDMEIVEVLVKNGELVEYDQPLFSVRKK